MGTSKKEVRQFYKQVLESRLRTLSADQKAEEQKALQYNLIQFLANKQGIWASYCHLPEEAIPDVDESMSVGIRWVFPRITGDHLEFVEAESFTVGPFGIKEPQSSKPPLSIHAIDGFLVPALAFDKTGGRLGRGKGFYDRALAQASGLKVGVAWHCQLSSTEIPAEIHDIRMDVVITEREILKLK